MAALRQGKQEALHQGRQEALHQGRQDGRRCQTAATTGIRSPQR